MFVRNTIGYSPKVPKAKFLECDGLFCFSSTCKFGSFKIPFAKITSLSELYFRYRRFILLVQTKKVTSMNYGSSTSSWNPSRWVRFHLILTEFTSSSRSTEFNDTLPWNISQIITKTSQLACEGIVISYAMKQGNPLRIWWNVNGYWDKNMIRISQWRGKPL